MEAKVIKQIFTLCLTIIKCLKQTFLGCICSKYTATSFMKKSSIHYYLLILLNISLYGCSKENSSTNAQNNETSKVFFKTNIANIFENRCASCHGIEQSSYIKFMDGDFKDYFYFPITKQNTIADVETTYQVSVNHDRVDYDDDARFSPILRTPLTEEYGGIAHKGLDIFYSTGDKDYQTILLWLKKEIAKKPKDKKELSVAAKFFEQKVQPTLVRNGCFLSSCHGPVSFTDLKLHPPLPDGKFSKKMTLDNKSSILGNVTRFVNLGGDLKRSRLLVKNIPIKNGGVHQRGGNNQFFEGYDDNDVKTILQWMRLEQKELFERLTINGKAIKDNKPGDVKDIVFIRGPRHTPRKYFSFDKYYPGSNIFFFNGEKESQLTFYKTAEIQSLDVSYDANKIVFSKKESGDSGFRIYELEIKTKKVTQLSFAEQQLSDGTIVHHIDPIYSPNNTLDHEYGYDLSDVSITYASNVAGAYASSEPWGIIGEADNTQDASKIIIHDTQRYEKAGTFTGLNVSFVKGPNKGLWRKIIKHTKNKLLLDRPLPHRVNIQTTYVIEKKQSNYTSSFDIWRFIPSKFKESNARMTWGFSQERRPTMRTSGEVMMTTVRNLGYQDDKPVFNGAIFRMQAGGFDFHPHGGERSQYALHSDDREMPEGLELKMLHDPRNFWGAGKLALVDHGYGASTEPNNPVDDIPLTTDYNNVRFSSLPRYISEMVTFDKRITHTGLSIGGAFRDPYPLADGTILTSFTGNSLDHLDPNADPDWDIWRIKFDSSLQSEDRHQIGNYKKTRIDKISTTQAEYNPRPVVIRLQENRHHPLQHQKFVKGHTPKIIHGVQRMPQGTPAEIEVYDFNLVASFLTNFTQTGKRNIPPKQAIKYVRAIGVLPLTKEDTHNINDVDPFATAVSKGVHTKKLIISEVPLETDSSLYVEVPSNTAWIIQALDKHKRAIFTLQRLFYTQPGERFTLSIPRSKFISTCGGCHGSLTGKPMDNIGPADIVTEASKVIATWNKQDQKRRDPVAKSAKLTDFISIDFIKDIQPVLNKHCISCHNSGDLNLTNRKTRHYNQAYESLHQLRNPKSNNFADKKYINEREALSSQSLLIDKLMTSNHHYLNEDELLLLIRWIDIGATFKGVF